MDRWARAALAHCQPGSTVVQMVSVGWPDVISSLKTLLETGEPLPA
jgi:hypothetical protein